MSRVRTTESNGPGLLGMIAAAGFALPIGAVVWFELVYLYFGLSGVDPPTLFNVVAATVGFGLAFGWPLFRAHRPAMVVRRACWLGMIVAALLPVLAFAVLLLWQNATGRPDLGMGGMMLYALPFVALGVAATLIIVFGIGVRLAERRLRPATKPV